MNDGAGKADFPGRTRERGSELTQWEQKEDRRSAGRQEQRLVSVRVGAATGGRQSGLSSLAPESHEMPPCVRESGEIQGGGLGVRTQLAPVLVRVGAQRASPQCARHAGAAPEMQRMEPLLEVSWRTLPLIAVGARRGGAGETLQSLLRHQCSLNGHLHPVWWSKRCLFLKLQEKDSPRLHQLLEVSLTCRHIASPPSVCAVTESHIAQARLCLEHGVQLRKKDYELLLCLPPPLNAGGKGHHGQYTLCWGGIEPGTQ